MSAPVPSESYQPTPEEISEYTAAFNHFDKNNEKKIPQEMLGSVFRALGFNPADVRLQTLKEDANLRDKRYVEFDEFMTIIARRRPEFDEVKQLKEAFAMFDIDADKEGAPRRGFVSSDELRKLLTTTGDRLESALVDELIKAADPTGLGYISYDQSEFVDAQFAPPPRKKKGKKKKK